MRLLLIPGFMMLCHIAFSQTYKRYWPDAAPQQPLYRNPLKDQVRIQKIPPAHKFETLIAPSKRKRRILFLPQDHMPCIVPSAVTLAAIPNYWKPADAYRIWTTPNLATPFRMDDLLKK